MSTNTDSKIKMCTNLFFPTKTFKYCNPMQSATSNKYTLNPTIFKMQKYVKFHMRKCSNTDPFHNKFLGNKHAQNNTVITITLHYFRQLYWSTPEDTKPASSATTSTSVLATRTWIKPATYPFETNLSYCITTLRPTRLFQLPLLPPTTTSSFSHFSDNAHIEALQ